MRGSLDLWRRPALGGPGVVSGVPGEPDPADMLSAWMAATRHPPDPSPQTVRRDPVQRGKAGA